MYIPQSTAGDVRGWYSWLWRGLKELKGVEWVGIPRALATHMATGPNAWIERANAVEQLTMRGYKTHALGMVRGNLRELDALFWEGCCSVDNSSPIWRGVHGMYLDNPAHVEAWDNHGIEVDFDWLGKDGDKAQPYYDSVVKYNMNLVLKRLGQELIK